MLVFERCFWCAWYCGFICYDCCLFVGVCYLWGLLLGVCFGCVIVDLFVSLCLHVGCQLVVFGCFGWLCLIIWLVGWLFIVVGWFVCVDLCRLLFAFWVVCFGCVVCVYLLLSFLVPCLVFIVVYFCVPLLRDLFVYLFVLRFVCVFSVGLVCLVVMLLVYDCMLCLVGLLC